MNDFTQCFGTTTGRVLAVLVLAAAIGLVMQGRALSAEKAHAANVQDLAHFASALAHSLNDEVKQRGGAGSFVPPLIPPAEGHPQALGVEAEWTK